MTNFAAANRDVTITAILNPASGPGNLTNADYVRVANSFVAAGGRLIAYIPSGYTGRTAASFSGCFLGPVKVRYTPQDVVDCAKGYQNLYPGINFSGIFVDEMGPDGRSGDTDVDSISFYSQVYTGLKSLNPNWAIFGNAGRSVPQGYLRVGSNGAADTIINYEDFANNYATATTASYVFSFSSIRFANILHTAPSTFNFSSFLTTAQSRNVSYIYVTDDTFAGNPYDSLPTNFAGQIASVRSFNVGK